MNRALCVALLFAASSSVRPSGGLLSRMLTTIPLQFLAELRRDTSQGDVVLGNSRWSDGGEVENEHHREPEHQAEEADAESNAEQRPPGQRNRLGLGNGSQPGEEKGNEHAPNAAAEQS